MKGRPLVEILGGGTPRGEAGLMYEMTVALAKKRCHADTDQYGGYHDGTKFISERAPDCGDCPSCKARRLIERMREGEKG